MIARKRSTSGPDAEILLAPVRPAFNRARRGIDEREVSNYLDMIEQERSDLGTALLLTQRRLREMEQQVEHYQAIETELTRSVHLAKQTAEAIVADAHKQAAQRQSDGEVEAQRHLSDGRVRLDEEARSLDGLRMAVAAEAASLADVESQLAGRISRAAAALVEIVDAPGGLGPFSQATSTLLEFAELLQRTSHLGQPAKIRFEVDGGATVANVSASGPRGYAVVPPIPLSSERPAIGLVAPRG